MSAGRFASSSNQAAIGSGSRQARILITGGVGSTVQLWDAINGGEALVQMRAVEPDIPPDRAR
eukprot:2072116-Prymnesium_polylepis.1